MAVYLQSKAGWICLVPKFVFVPLPHACSIHLAFWPFKPIISLPLNSSTPSTSSAAPNSQVVSLQKDPNSHSGLDTNLLRPWPSLGPKRIMEQWVLYALGSVVSWHPFPFLISLKSWVFSYHSCTPSATASHPSSVTEVQVQPTSLFLAAFLLLQTQAQARESKSMQRTEVGFLVHGSSLVISWHR